MRGRRHRWGIPILLFFAGACGPTPSSAPPFELTGVWHRVSDRDTVAAIASRYSVSADAVRSLNDISDDQSLRQRVEVFVPTLRGERPGATPDRSGEGRPVAKAPDPGARRADCVSLRTRCLRWPVSGKISAGFDRSGKPHDGIDISAPAGTVVRAAADGTVLYSGDGIKGYGNLIIIRHEGRLITVYAHNRVNRVAEGDAVRGGDPIAELGSSGSAVAPHLHFEVRENEQPVDPLRFLPALPE